MSQRQEFGEVDEPTGVEHGRPPGPLRVKVEFVVVDGEEARLFKARQVRAIRGLLKWMVEQEGGANTGEARGGSPSPDLPSI